jgi:DNA-binding CsgD family transcriptional regulator
VSWELSVVEQRCQAVLALIEDGLPITEVAAKVGVSRQTVQWLEDWISRRVAASNRIISVTSQPFRVGKHHSGAIVDVHVTDRLLEVWSGNELIRTVVRTSTEEVRKKRAGRTVRTSP